MTRIHNWQSALSVAIDQQERLPHVYGQTDCVMRVGINAAALLREPKHGEILAAMERYRGRYTSLTGAYRVLRKDGLTPLSLIGKHFDELDHPVMAGDGDIGALKQDGKHWAFGTFIRGHLYVATENGIGILPRGLAQKAWRVE